MVEIRCRLGWSSQRNLENQMNDVVTATVKMDMMNSMLSGKDVAAAKDLVRARGNWFAMDARGVGTPNRSAPPSRETTKFARTAAGRDTTRATAPHSTIHNHDATATESTPKVMDAEVVSQEVDEGHRDNVTHEEPRVQERAIFMR